MRDGHFSSALTELDCISRFQVSPMAKTKHMHLSTLAEERKNEPPKEKRDRTADKEAVILTDPMISNDEWIEIRKQRIIIIIPSLPRNDQNLQGLKQKNRKKVTQSLANTKEVQTTCFKRRRFKRTGQTNMNTALPQEDSVLGTGQDGRMINKIQSHVEEESSMLMFNKDAESHQAMTEYDISAINPQHSIPVNADNMKLRQRRRKRDHALGISYYFKRARRPRRLEHHVSEEGLRKMVPSALTEVLLASNQIVGPKMKVQHENEHSNEQPKIQDPGKCDYVVKGMPSMLTNYEQVESPEVPRIAPGTSLPCIDFTRLKQSASIVPMNNKSELLKEEDSHVSYKETTGFSLNSTMNGSSEMLTTPDNKGKTTKTLATPLSNFVIPSREDITYTRVIGNGHLMPSAVLYLSSDGSTNSYACHGLSLTSKAIRAYTLKKQLDRAGGLKRWLFSLGLEQFIQPFERKNVDEVDLIHLSMSDLKSMGTIAVGPRRKLIWAIDCLSQKLAS